ncbi:MAG TPA: hypothetical protein VHQ94_11770 [Pyrinomonadaceae bacterium]|nr:hypothetical protein [Pyrinomonadaceae bacterium]
MTLLLAQAAIGTWCWRIRRGCERSLLAVCCGLMLAASCFAASDDSARKPCRDSVDSYLGYKISNVRIVTPLSIRTPLSFLFGSQKKLGDEFDALLQRMPVKKGDPFDRAAHNAAMEMLFDRYAEKLVSPGERIRVAFTTFRFEDCDDVARTISISYLVYSTEFLYFASRIFEKPGDQITRSLAPGKLENPDSLANTNNKLLPQPFAGYDRAREVFGGAKAAFNTENGIINKVDLGASGSANSATADFNLAGAKDFAAGFLSHVDWRMGYNYFNLPSDPNQLKAGTGLGQIFGATRPIGSHDLTFRFGASVEGGNRQSELPVSITDPNVAQQLGYGALKAYLGATANHDRRSWTASYGLQLSSDGDLGLNYTKHIFDAGYRLRYLWREHRPFRLEAQVTAGAIRTRGKPVPVAERFFGGNKVRSFIDGDDWIINTAPIIRSFPQNTFNLVGSNLPIGGENFFSANVTLSQPVWNFPAVPFQISQEQIVRDALGGQLRTARVATVKSYLEEEPGYVTLNKALLGDAAPSDGPPSGNLVTLSQAVDQVEEKLAAIGRQNPPSEVSDAMAAVSDEPDLGADLVADSKDAIEAARTDTSAFKAKVRELIAGSNTRKGLIIRLITRLDNVVDALRRAPLPAAAQDLGNTVSTLKQISTSMEPQVAKLLAIGKVDIALYRPVMAVVKTDASDDDIDGVVKQIAATVEAIKKRANTIPNTGRAALLQPADIKLPKPLAVKLRDGSDSVSAFLNSQFTQETRDLLKAYKDTEDPPDQLLRALISELNRLISGPSLFTDDRFSDADLTDATEELAGSNPQGAALIGLNRSLLAEAFPREISKSQLDDALDPLDGFVKDATDTLSSLDGFESSDADDVRSAVHQLVMGFGDLSPAVTASISSEVRKLQRPLTNAGLQTEAQALLAENAKLTSLQKRARDAFNSIPLTKLEQQADRDIAYAARSLDVIFREINLVEIAPVVTFDAARIGPGVSPGFGKTHYGLGAGVRFSIVTLDFTAGYSFNLNRQPTEPRGAVLLSMTISDLFR